MNIIEMKNVDKSYGKNKVLDNVTFSIEKGHIVGLIGPNGAGKSTIMKIISGLIHRSGGELKLFENDRDIHKNRNRISFMIENPIIDLSLTAYENMQYMRMLRGVSDEARINELLTYVKLNDVNKNAKYFSLGMKQRLGIAMALLPDPDVLVLDEPINGLDPEGIYEIRYILKDLCENQGKTIIISSHILSELSELCTDYIIINKGNIVESISTEELLSHSRSYISVKTDNINKTAATLEKKMQLSDYKMYNDNELRIYEKLDNIAEISKTITDSGFIILQFVIQNESLEEYYLSKVDSSVDTKNNSKRFKLFRKKGA